MTNQDAPGFDEPLAMLRAFHRELLEHCDILEGLVRRLDEQGCDDEARAAARKIISCFSNRGRLHHRDEEEDLFPLLIRQSLKLADLVNSLKQEHKEIDALWGRLEPGLKQLDRVDGDDFARLAAEFCRLNRQHVRREEGDFLPLAENSLSHQQIKGIGRGMAERRGVSYWGL